MRNDRTKDDETLRDSYQGKCNSGDGLPANDVNMLGSRTLEEKRETR